MSDNRPAEKRLTDDTIENFAKDAAYEIGRGRSLDSQMIAAWALLAMCKELQEARRQLAPIPLPSKTATDLLREIESIMATGTAESAVRDIRALVSSPVETKAPPEIDLLKAALLQCYCYYADGPIHSGWIYHLIPDSEEECKRLGRLMREQSSEKTRAEPDPKTDEAGRWEGL